MTALTIALFGFAAVLTAINVHDIVRGLQRDEVKRAWALRRRVNHRRRMRKAGQTHAARIKAIKIRSVERN